MVRAVILTRDKILFNNSSLNINEEGNIDVSGTIIGDISSNAVSISEYNALYKKVIMQEGMIAGLESSVRSLKTFSNYPPEPEPEPEPEP